MIMSNELVITKYQENTFACYYEEGKLSELQVLSDHGSGISLIGNIYVARVQNIVQNIDAAFIEIAPGQVCYYSLLDNQHLFLNAKKNEKLVIGDELLVQIEKDAIKSKAPIASAGLQVSGNLVVVKRNLKKVMISHKLPKDERTDAIRNALESRLEHDFGVILRTNAYESPVDAVIAEYEELSSRLYEIINQARYHKVFSCLYTGNSPLEQMYNSYNNASFRRIVTDIPEVYEELQAMLQKKGTSGESNQPTLELFEQKLQPLYAIYRMDRDIKELISKRVWLKSGAYLVIEQTEAMVVIDVNTGKAVDKKGREDHFLRVNKEAATEIARQLRLRNLSGIIMIDFINMQDSASRESLIHHLIEELKKDRITTNYIEMTKLNLVELTRKKIHKSLSEQLMI